MSAVQPQSDAERLLASLLREQRPAQPALDADLAVQFARAIVRELRQQAAPEQPAPMPAATLGPTKPLQCKPGGAWNGIVNVLLLAGLLLALLLGMLGLGKWLGIIATIDPPAQVASTAAPSTGMVGGPAQQVPAVVNVYLATPVPAQATPESTPVPPAPGAPDFPASFQVSPDNGAYLTCFNPTGCNPSGAPQSSGGPSQAVVGSVRQAPVTPRDFQQAADNSAFVGCLVPGGCNPSPAQPVLPAPGQPGFVESFR